jgi:DNA-binding protein HU-beta
MTKAKTAAEKPKAAASPKTAAAPKGAAPAKAPAAAAPAKAPAAAKQAQPVAAAPAPAPAPKEKVELVTLRQIAVSISETCEITQKQANELLSSTVELIGKHLKQGARIRVGGLGTFEVRKRPERTGRNPATGEPIKIKASKKVAFRAAKELSEAV